MAITLLSTVNPFLHSTLSSSSASSSSASPSPSSCSSSASTISIFPHKNRGERQFIQSRAACQAAKSAVVTKRDLSVCLTSTFLFSMYKGCFNANAAILEADDDEELLEKVKNDRKKRLERQGVINNSNSETAYLQEAVYKLSKVGQAIDNNDLSAASSVLGPSTDVDWVQKANIAFTKVLLNNIFTYIWFICLCIGQYIFYRFQELPFQQLSSSPEEKTEVDIFNSSLASLISSVIRNDVESSKIAFVSSAGALEKWTALTGLVGQLKGL